MATNPTDVEFTDTTSVIYAAWLNGVNDWVYGSYGVLGSTYTAAAFRSSLGLAVGTFTTSALGAAGTDARTVAHGLGTDNIDFGFMIVGDSGTFSEKLVHAGAMLDANGNMVTEGDCYSGSYTYPTAFSSAPAAGNLSFRIQTGPAQALTVKWWARKRA